MICAKLAVYQLLAHAKYARIMCDKTQNQRNNSVVSEIVCFRRSYICLL